MARRLFLNMLGLVHTLPKSGLKNLLKVACAIIKANRDIPGEDGTSKLAENLSAGRDYSSAMLARWLVGATASGNPGAESFLKRVGLA